MESVLQQILGLIEKGTVEQRCAGLLITGALKLEQVQVIKTVAAALDHPNPVVKDFALRYFEAVRAKGALSSLLPFLDDTDKEIQERTVRLLSQAGEAVVDPVLQAAPAASRSWQINAARVLCAVRGKAALQGLLQMLAGGTDEFNKTVCDLTTPAIREMEATEQEHFYKEVEAFATKLDPNQQRPAVTSAIRLLGQLGRPEARRWLIQWVSAGQPLVLRSHALVGLLRCLRDQKIRKDEYAKLLPLVEEPEFTEVTRLAMELLDIHGLPEDARALLSRLLESRHADVQRFALRKMGDLGTPATVRTLIDQLGDPDYRRREIAARSLHKIPEARSALVKELIACDDPSKAWSIAELLPGYEGKWRQDTLESLWKRLQAAITSEERIQSAFLHVLKQAGSEDAYAQLAAQAGRLIKAKKYKEALSFLTPLKEFSGFKPEDKFRFALAQLKAHSYGVASHRQQPVIDLLCDLYRNSAFPLFETIKKEKTLTPDDLFYLGFTFAERHGEERNLGKDLLEHVAAKFPRNKIGRNAKNKLKLLER